MKAKEVVLSIAIALLFCFQIIFPVATAHTGGIFTIIVSENGVVPGNVQMLVNDTARWINVDDTENTTHRILVDANSDGIYDGEEDWNSGNYGDFDGDGDLDAGGFNINITATGTYYVVMNINSSSYSITNYVASTDPSDTGTAAASDNCDSSVTVTYSDTTVAGTGNNSVITRVWTATDDNSNATTYTQTITVVDTTAPTVVTQAYTLTLGSDGTATLTTANVDNGTSDNCDSSLTLSLSKTAFDCTNIGENTITLTATAPFLYSRM